MSEYVGAVGAVSLARKLRQVPVTARPALARRLRGVGEQVKQDAAGRAAWSTRIPGSLTLQAKFSGRFVGVSILARVGAAPHARPYEGITGAATFRHPLNYPRQDGWVTQKTRPFLAPAVAAHRGEVVTAIEAAVDDAIKAAGV